MKLLPPTGSEGKAAYLVDRGADQVRTYSSETSNTALFVMSLAWLFFAWLLYLGITTPENSFATKCVLSVLFGAALYFIIMMMISTGTWEIDRINRTFTIESRVAGFPKKKKVHSFDELRHVEVSQRMTRSGEVGNRKRTYFPVTLALIDGELPFSSSRNREESIHQAEGLARYLGVPLKDKTKGADGEEFDPSESFD